MVADAIADAVADAVAVVCAVGTTFDYSARRPFYRPRLGKLLDAKFSRHRAGLETY